MTGTARITELCWECDENPVAFKCLRCREDVCATCPEVHVCADQRTDDDDEEPAE